MALAATAGVTLWRIYECTSARSGDRQTDKCREVKFGQLDGADSQQTDVSIRLSFLVVHGFIAANGKHSRSAISTMHRSSSTLATRPIQQRCSPYSHHRPRETNVLLSERNAVSLMSLAKRQHVASEFVFFLLTTN